jgi:putative hemolysin
MDLDPLSIIEIIILFFLQLVISGGLASFAIVSRMHEDKAFPREIRGSWCPRYLHRGRLHLILTLIWFEMVMLVVIAIAGYQILEGTAMRIGGSFVLTRFVSILFIAALIAAATVAGIGLASRNPVRLAYLLSYPLLPVYVIFKPIVALFLKLVSFIFPRLPRELSSPFFLFSHSDDQGEGFIEENGSRLIHSIFEFGAKKVREVMVPRIDVIAFDIHTPLNEVRVGVARAGHSRMPVYDGSIDRIVGILYVKDLLGVPADEEGLSGLAEFVRKPHYVPEGKKIDDLLREFQKEKKHMAVVVDEYGGTAGIVTLEDILEEIVGEIRDEYDQELPLLRKTGPNRFLVAGRINLDELNEELKMHFSAEEVDTLGGFLYDLIGRVPEEGEEIEHEGILFTINRLEGLRIAEVSLQLPDRGKDEE